MSLKNGYREVEIKVSLDNILDFFPGYLLNGTLKSKEEVAKIEFIECVNGSLSFRLGIRKEGEVQVIHHNAGKKKT